MSESALAEINLRRAVLYSQTAIEELLHSFTGELIDDVTFAAVQKAISGFMQSMQDRGAIKNHEVFCDARFNPPDSIDQGILVALVRFQLPRSSETVEMRFTRGGADEATTVVLPDDEVESSEPPCICTEACTKPCKGGCGCQPCHDSYQDFLSSE